jgi:hypothetical protein
MLKSCTHARSEFLKIEYFTYHFYRSSQGDGRKNEKGRPHSESRRSFLHHLPGFIVDIANHGNSTSSTTDILVYCASMLQSEMRG